MHSSGEKVREKWSEVKQIKVGKVLKGGVKERGGGGAKEFGQNILAMEKKVRQKVIKQKRLITNIVLYA